MRKTRDFSVTFADYLNVKPVPKRRKVIFSDRIFGLPFIRFSKIPTKLSYRLKKIKPKRKYILLRKFIRKKGMVLRKKRKITRSKTKWLFKLNNYKRAFQKKTSFYHLLRF